jgi:hypothetical protein
MIAAWAGLILPIVAVWLAMRAFAVRPRSAALMTAVLSFAAGIGLSSFSTLLLVAAGVSIGPRFVAIDALLWISVIVICGVLVRRRRLDVGSVDQRRHIVSALDRTAVLVRCVFAIVMALGAATLVMEYVRAPHGQWDAWAIWNQKARFLFRGGRDWTAMMEVGWSNPGHPMLVSTSVARLWAYAGHEATLIPAMVAALFGAAIVGGVVAALDPRRNRAWIAGALVLAPTTVLHQIAAQTADLPLSLYVLLTIVLLRAIALRPSTSTEQRSLLILAGLIAGIGAWTKNEGLVLFAATTVLVAWWSVVARRIGPLGWWLAASTPLVLIVLWYKVAVAPVAPEYMPQSEGVGSVARRFLDPARPLLVVTSAWHYWLAWGGRYAAGILPAVTIAAGATAFVRAGRPLRGLLLTLCVMFAGYSAIWLIAPFDPSWLIATTFDRLMIQLWPSLVVIAFSVTDAGSPSPRTDSRIQYS